MSRTPKSLQPSPVLAIVGSGIFTGGGLLIGISGVRWLRMDPLAWQAGFWDEFSAFAVAIIPAFVLAVVGIVGARRNDASVPRARRWWTVALVLWIVNSLITSVYHLPENLALRGLVYSAPEAAAVRTMWLTLHVPRVLLAMGMFVATVLAGLWGAAGRARGTQP